MRDINNQEAIEILNRCRHEIIELRTELEYLKPKAEAYNIIAIILKLPTIHPGKLYGDDLIHTIQKRIDELILKPEANPTESTPKTPLYDQYTKQNRFDPDSYAPKNVEAANAKPNPGGDY